MTLIDLLMVMFFVLQITTAVGAARDSHAGFIGYTAVSLLGLAIAIVWIVGVYKTLGHFGEPAIQEPENKRLQRTLSFVAFGCLFWEIAGTALSTWLAPVVLRHIR